MYSIDARGLGPKNTIARTCHDRLRIDITSWRAVIKNWHYRSQFTVANLEWLPNQRLYNAGAHLTNIFPQFAKWRIIFGE